MISRITIQGRQYTVRSDDEEIDLVAVSRFVDERVQQMVRRTRKIDDYTAVVLAALNIAEEYERFRRQMDRELGQLDRELASAAVLLESSDGEDDEE